MPTKKKAANKAKPARTKPNGDGRVAAVVALLKRKGGASPDELMKTFGWLPHTTRGFISKLASKYGYNVKSERVDGVRRYSL
jgi:hypothetical protein